MKTLNWSKYFKNPFRRQSQKDIPHSHSSRPSIQTPAICGDQSDTPILKELDPLIIIRSTKDLPLKDFIDICCFDKYGLLVKGRTVLSEGEFKEVGIARNEILSEYHELIGDEEAKQYFKLTGRKMALDIRRKTIELLSGALKQMYTPGAAEAMRLYFNDMEFTIDTYLRDLHEVEVSEVENLIELQEIDADLKEIQKKEGTAIDAKAREKGFYNTVMDFNQIEHGSYNIETMSTYMYALAQNRIKKHIENLERQNKKQHAR